MLLCPEKKKLHAAIEYCDPKTHYFYFQARVCW